MSKYNKYTKEEIQQIIEFYKNHSLKETGAQFNISSGLVKRILIENNQSLRNKSESSKLGLVKYKKTSLDKYGVEFPAQAEEVKEKYKQTCLEKYGVQCALQNFKVDKKSRETMIQKYGVEYPAQSSQILEKQKKTNLERYGSLYTVQSEQIREKSKCTLLEKYGVDNPFKSEEVKTKIKQTNLDRYGATNISQSSKFKERLTNRTELEWQIIKDKRNRTKRINNSFNISKPEELYYEYLLSIYEEDDIVRQYSSDKYPFSCDFYIKSEDLYIECNYNWTHGPHPFNENDKEDQELLKSWKIKSENSNYYKNAIYTWTDLDIRKQKTAKENNLNYQVLYE